MNAHQRRVTARRRHMDLPLGKEVDLRSLGARRMYFYRLGRVELYSALRVALVSARVSRHIRPWRACDLALTAANGAEEQARVSTRGLRLLDQRDRAARPWWAMKAGRP